jgi:hypothetical protein
LSTWSAKDKRKLWGANFLIKFFYEYNDRKKREVTDIANMAIAIDKMQTFYMAHSHNVKPGVKNPDLKKIKTFIRNLKKDFQYEYKLEIDEISGWFSSDDAKKCFERIYRSNEFDPNNEPNDRLLAFQLADGLLEENKIKERAVLEFLFFRMKKVDMLGHEESKKIQGEFTETLEGDGYKKIIESFSDEDIEECFKYLGTEDGIVDYFNYQKYHGYPLISGQLYEAWVNSAIEILDKIIDKIKNILKDRDNYSKIGKYFPALFDVDTPLIFEQKLQFYNDNNFHKTITYSNNKLSSLILEIFSDLDIELFGVCENKSCNKPEKDPDSKESIMYRKPEENPDRKVFIKYPRPEKEFCSNKCAACHGTSEKRKRERQKMTH